MRRADRAMSARNAPTSVTSTSGMSRSVRSLYAALLREARTWPVEPTRRDRSIVVGLEERIKSDFRAHKNLTDQNEIWKHVTMGKNALNLMKNLKENHYMKKVQNVYFFLFQLRGRSADRPPV